jgi:phosphoribosylformylglycinamidine synthase
LEKPLKIPIAHADGRYYADQATLNELVENDQILFTYCDESGNETKEANPNGAEMNIAGICNRGRNVFGMMPHPERASEVILGNMDGKVMFESMVSMTTASMAQ